MIKRVFIAALGCGLLACGAIAKGEESITQVLQFNPAYVNEIAKQSNQVSVQATRSVRQAVKGEPVTIPGDWRLVNVIAKSNDYVMFFQGGDGSVRSLRMQPDGSISGQDMIWIQAR